MVLGLSWSRLSKETWALYCLVEACISTCDGISMEPLLRIDTNWAVVIQLKEYSVIKKLNDGMSTFSYCN